MARVELKNVSRVFRPRRDEEIHAVAQLNLSVANGELLALVGPSGCGKTTTLRLIAGLDAPTAGTIHFDQIDVTAARPEERNVAMVFQRDALYPHLKLVENLCFPLEVRGVSGAEKEQRVTEIAAALGLSGLLERYPATLSGGQRQRAALARALVRRPRVCLLDEPLSQLDTPTRVQLRREIARVQRQCGVTMIYVTHDQAEAVALGDRLVVMREGAVQQSGDAATLYAQPANMFVAGFIGAPPMNLIRGRVASEGGQFVFHESNPAGAANGSHLRIPVPSERGERLSRFAEGNLVIGLRADQVGVEPGGQGNTATVEAIEFNGSDAHVHLQTGAHLLVARVPLAGLPGRGERVSLRVAPHALWFFNPVSGAAIV